MKNHSHSHSHSYRQIIFLFNNIHRCLQFLSVRIKYLRRHLWFMIFGSFSCFMTMKKANSFGIILVTGILYLSIIRYSFVIHSFTIPHSFTLITSLPSLTLPLSPCHYTTTDTPVEPDGRTSP